LTELRLTEFHLTELRLTEFHLTELRFTELYFTENQVFFKKSSRGTQGF
jgi:hypothetical protein